MAKLSERQLVCVIWDDAHHSLDEYSLEEIERNVHKPMRLHLFGLLVKSDDVGVTVAMEEEPTSNGVRHVFFVPRPMVVEEILLGQPRRKKERKPKSERPPD